MTHRYLALCAVFAVVLALTLGSRASAQIDLDAIRRGVQGCPQLAADAGLGTLAAYLCDPVDRTSLDLPITLGPQAIQIRAGSFSLLQRQALLNLARGSLGESEFHRLRGLLVQGSVLSRTQDALRRALTAEGQLAQAQALLAGTFDASNPELLATRIDRDRIADLRAGVFAKLGGSDTIPSYSGGLVGDIIGQVGGVPFAVDADGNLVFGGGVTGKAAYPFFIGPDGLVNTLDDLPYLTNNPAAQAAGYSFAAPISGTSEDRFDAVQTGSIPIPFFSMTAQISVPSALNPSVQKIVEVFGVYNVNFVKLNGCLLPQLGGIGGTYDRVTNTCTNGLGQDVTADAQARGCGVLANRFSTTRLGIGRNADGDCIELNASNAGDANARVQFEVLDLLGDPRLRPVQAGIEPSDLTDLQLRSRGRGLAARPPSPNATAVFPPVTGGFRRNVDGVTGAPVAASGGTCRIRVDGSSTPIGPNGVAGDGDDVFPSAGECLLWGAPGVGGAQALSSPSVVAASHSANQTLFHELCSATFDEDVAHCSLDSFTDVNTFDFLSKILGGFGQLAGVVIDGAGLVRTPANPLETVQGLNGNILAVQFQAVNPNAPPNTLENNVSQDLGVNFERGQAALLGCGIDFANPCSLTQGAAWNNDPTLRASLGPRTFGGIDLMNADATVLVQEFSAQKALHAGDLVGVAANAANPNDPPLYLPGMNYSRNGTFVAVENPLAPGQFGAIELGQYLSLTPADVLGMSDAQRAAYQHADPNKVQADGWVEPMPWATDPNALATFGAVVFQSDPNDPIAGPGNVFNHAGGQIYGEYCGRWMNTQSSLDVHTPFNATCTALETVSANLERLLMAQEVVGRDRVFDPPESLAELSAMLDDDPSNDATGDPISGPDGIFAANQAVFRDDEMDFQVLPLRNADIGTQIILAPANKAAALTFLHDFDPNVSCTQGGQCLYDVTPILTDPTDSPSAFPRVLDLPIGFGVDLVDDSVPPQVIGATKVNLAALRFFDLAKLRRLFAGQVVEVNGAFVQMNNAQRQSLIGLGTFSTIPTRDLNGDGINDLDQDNDGVWDGQDDYTPGPVSDDEILCGSGIRGDKMLEEGIQYEPYRADQAPGSAAFQSLFPNGLPPRSPVFCRSLNSLLALVGDAPDGTRQFVWHGALAGEGTDLDGDSVPDGVDNCPTVANQSQSDGDADGVGDACDNCLAVANPRVAADYLAQNPWATLTGGQRDDDHDGYGNRCDAKFTGSAGLVGSSDLAELRSSVNRSRTLDTCGATHDRPCAIFDLNEADGLIGGGDVSAFRAAVNRVPGPKCPTCPLTCTAGAQGSCN